VRTSKFLSDIFIFSKLHSYERINQLYLHCFKERNDTSCSATLYNCHTKFIHFFRGMANVIVPDRSLCWYVPDNWSLEDAATVPCVYATCYYALYMSGEMKRNHKVLIHSGTGGVGQAAIHLALHEGCEVFTTVGTQEKRNFIREKFPSISDDHIGISHDTSFEQLILQQTQGLGVNIILNSLAEEKLQASIRCLAKNGRFLEIGKFDLMSNNFLGMMVFLKEISFHGIFLDNIFSNTKEKLRLHNLLAEGLKTGVVKPLVRKVFEREDAIAAFKYMTTRKHIGKVNRIFHEIVATNFVLYIMIIYNIYLKNRK